MTSLILLIRHAAHSHLGGRLSGRTPGIALSGEGQSQAEKLAERLQRVAIDALQSSPIQRAHETATAIARRRRTEIEMIPALQELDFGDWSGRDFVELADDPLWNDWNSTRASTTAPNGESMVQAQARAWAHVQRAAAAWPEQTVAMVTHRDIILAVVARILGLSLNQIHHFEADPASVSRISIGSWGAKVLSLNETLS